MILAERHSGHVRCSLRGIVETCSWLPPSHRSNGSQAYPVGR
jgi:hypothetical protein